MKSKKPQAARLDRNPNSIFPETEIPRRQFLVNSAGDATVIELPLPAITAEQDLNRQITSFKNAKRPIALLLGFALFLPILAHADDVIISESISNFQRLKADVEAATASKPVAKAADYSGYITFVRLVSVNQGQLNLAWEKCEPGRKQNNNVASLEAAIVK